MIIMSIASGMLGMMSFGGLAGRAGIGAAVGGFTGTDNGGGGFLGGAAMGAAAGAIGPWGARKLLGKRNAVGMAAALGERVAHPLMAGASTLGNRTLFNAAKSVRTGAWWMGQNQVKTNKWGGRAMLGLGMASAGTIGSSLLDTNRGY